MTISNSTNSKPEEDDIYDDPKYEIKPEICYKKVLGLNPLESLSPKEKNFLHAKNYLDFKNKNEQLSKEELIRINKWIEWSGQNNDFVPFEEFSETLSYLNQKTESFLNSAQKIFKDRFKPYLEFFKSND